MIIKCPECQKDVSSEASNCPHCGYNFIAVAKKTVYNESMIQGCQTLVGVGCFVVIFLLVCLQILNGKSTTWELFLAIAIVIAVCAGFLKLIYSFSKSLKS